MTKATITIDSTNTVNKLPTFIKGEFGFDINFVLSEDDGTAINLAGKTVQFQTKNLNSTTRKIDGTCTIVDAATGSCKYSVLETDMDEVAIFESEVELFETGVSNRKIKLGTFAVFDEI